jgi:hypothetical protein
MQELHMSFSNPCRKLIFILLILSTNLFAGAKRIKGTNKAKVTESNVTSNIDFSKSNKESTIDLLIKSTANFNAGKLTKDQYIQIIMQVSQMTDFYNKTNLQLTANVTNPNISTAETPPQSTSNSIIASEAKTSDSKLNTSELNCAAGSVTFEWNGCAVTANLPAGTLHQSTVVDSTKEGKIGDAHVICTAIADLYEKPVVSSDVKAIWRLDSGRCSSNTSTDKYYDCSAEAGPNYKKLIGPINAVDFCKNLAQSLNVDKPQTTTLPSSNITTIDPKKLSSSTLSPKYKGIKCVAGSNSFEWVRGCAAVVYMPEGEAYQSANIESTKIGKSGTANITCEPIADLYNKPDVGSEVKAVWILTSSNCK